ncbi:glycoside hydrolase family 131 protein [Stemphylium lycopersici]|uniref:Glycoside hydrolase family 131 protein n=1 Tax=Stemphylium lycopersici TaxID=183478 RepID=A0A364MWN7_STELY|nr:glycoside hydrolase family 131 protein [Stemphylium lycopersici]RAR05557.1 glycoside hydrolase family 131 protein [Stemphylium lycopersici]RAR06931.1 glycoside hydrolase family 131 protein [Stemphylium lycopersici]
MFGKTTLMSALLSAASAEIIWDGRFNDMTSSSELEDWSFSNPVGSYQYYIHGDGPVTDYVNLDASFKNPADAASKQGAKITIDETAKWNGQTMLRTELIPQTDAAINKGKVYYHFSVKTSSENKPTATNEHQVAFFESHFTELKYGASGSSNTNLQWHVGGVSKWDVELVADEWHNVAYEIDFDAGSVSFWHSTGSDELTQTAGPFDASTQSNGADWHLGVLRLPGSNDADGAEDWFFSGVYIEDGELTTKVGSGEVDAEKPAAPKPAASSKPAVSSTAVPAASSSTKAVVETPAASSSAAPVETPVASSSAAPVESTAVSSTPAASSPASVETPVASSIAAAAPTATAGVGSGSDAVLPEEFTIKQFVAWLKAKQGKN